MSNEVFIDFLRKEISANTSSYEGAISLNIIRNRQISEADRQMLISKLIDLTVEFKAFAHLLVGDKAQVGLTLGRINGSGSGSYIAELKEAMDGYEHNSPPAGD